jgi:hypothetical protein
MINVYGFNDSLLHQSVIASRLDEVMYTAFISMHEHGVISRDVPSWSSASSLTSSLVTPWH